jgi:hypothetical protein
VSTLWPVVAPLAAFALARALMGRRQDFDRHADEAVAVANTWSEWEREVGR